MSYGQTSKYGKTFDVTVPWKGKIEYSDAYKKYERGVDGIPLNSTNMAVKVQRKNILPNSELGVSIITTETAILKCKTNGIDTIVVASPGKTYSVKDNRLLQTECNSSNYGEVLSKLNRMQNGFEKSKSMHLAYWAEQDSIKFRKEREQFIADSLRRVENEKRNAITQAEREKNQAEQNRKSMLGSYEYEFVEPTGPIQTKSITGNSGAKIVYEYYVNENGYEVKHGEYTINMTYNNHKYWTGLDVYGWVYLDGFESLTYHYRNGIVHGKLIYRRDVRTESTFGNAMNLKDSYNLDIYKGFLTDNFKFEYKGITYVGKAVNGILEYCDYQTNDGFNGKIISNPNSKSVSVAEINNGYRTFEFDINIGLPYIIATMPSFRFPLIGK